MAKAPNFVKFPYIPPSASPPHYFPPWPNLPPPPNNHQSPPRPHPPRPNVPPPPSNHPSPPPHPPTTPPPPSPAVKPPPHPIPPPPPLHPISPPPPHTVPAPPPPPHHHTVIIIVFVSFGGLFFLAFMAAAIFCCIKKKKKRVVKETDKFKIEDHVKVREEMVAGPHGTQTVVLTIDEDVHVEEEIVKSSATATEVKPKADQINSQASAITESASTSNHHHKDEGKE